MERKKRLKLPDNNGLLGVSKESTMDSLPEDNKMQSIIEGPVNPFTGKLYSTNYYAILRKRKELPVWRHRKEFLELFRQHQILVLVGETGSGKTTQVAQFALHELLFDGGNLRKMFLTRWWDVRNHVGWRP